MARETLIAQVPLPRENVHRVPAEMPDPRDAAARYETMLRDFFDLDDRAFPQLDLALLGLGADGHTASLFPGDAAVDEERRLAVAAPGPGDVVGEWRITLTLPVLNRAASVVVLVSGAGKTAMLHRALEGPETEPLLPIQRLRPQSGTLVWMVDREAAPWVR